MTLGIKKKRIYLLTTMLLCLCTTTRAADVKDSIQWFAETANRFNRVFPQEKVYLHLDNTGYFMGETMWMKAYMVRTDKDSLGSLSRVLYVELLDPFGEVVKSQKLKVENGMAHGDIELTGLLTSGFCGVVTAWVAVPEQPFVSVAVTL